MNNYANGMSAIGPPWSQLTAYDLNTGKILWQVPNGEMPGLPGGKTEAGSYAPRGGVTATAGGLLFVGTSSDRKLRAYDQDTGKVLWSMDVPAAVEGVPTVYEVGGRAVRRRSASAAARACSRRAASASRAARAGAIHGVRVAEALNRGQRRAGSNSPPRRNRGLEEPCSVSSFLCGGESVPPELGAGDQFDLVAPLVSMDA